MKRSLIFIVMAVTTMGSIWASGQADVTSNSVMTKDKKEFISADTIQVEATADILAVFEDNDDDELYDGTLPFLTGKGKSSDMTMDMNDYVSSILKNDTDDIIELIRDELTSPLEAGISEESFMVLGNYKATAYEAESNIFNITLDKLAFIPVNSTSVTPSSDILIVFEDNDDDELYGSAFPFLSTGANINTIDRSTLEYIEDIILDDTDDLSDLIKSELKASMSYGDVEESTMVLGNYQFTATMEDKGLYTYKIEELEYEPAKSIQIFPSSDILAVFEDNDDDSLYRDAISYLNSGTGFNYASTDVLDYIDDIVNDDTDDLSDLIRDELNEVLSRGDIEGAYMVLGGYVFTASLDYVL